MEELPLLQRQTSVGSCRRLHANADFVGCRADDHPHALHGLPLYLRPFFSNDLSVYRQTDDWPRVKCEVFLFRMRFCVYAE
ncbi:hypothetical protein GFL91_15185 [Rhizobium leguminosarum bv. viciae]|uniref:Uncharacterized protein n=1 Tax=Rhizobium leguminosarum bv. viciae TaxID=387 RepID=A0A8I2KFM0_RHILV|nr:hypothetical protein [Rhizobium leguminosarum bv. viciae]TCA01578.1 hypothetical protein E0H57_22420 [Rhizobium leguminosarum bv. viciae]